VTCAYNDKCVDQHYGQPRLYDNEELPTLLEHLSLPPVFSWVSCYSIFSFTCMCMFCRLLFVLLYFFFWPLLCLSFFKLRILITPLVSSNSSYTIMKKLTYSRKCCINLINSIDHENEVVVGWNILVDMYPPWSTCGPSMLMEKLTNRKSVT
jgi:hypothetical protein